MGYRLATDASRTTSNGGGWRDWGIGPCQISLGLTEPLLCPSLLGLIPESLGLIIQCLHAGLFRRKRFFDDLTYKHFVFTTVAATLWPEGFAANGASSDLGRPSRPPSPMTP